MGGWEHSRGGRGRGRGWRISKGPVVVGNDLLGSYTHLILQVLQELWAWSEDAL